ncbi:hypothetical protein Fmac_018920 [Flemingia macrophylla]|uniref:Uncharacterized protein n=1 Tax=Flemingia macrophylla TaxID=520843 RepID=A0ABD1M6E0_9FABA
MARLKHALLITLLVLVCYSSVLDARKILKFETQEVLFLKGTPPTSKISTSYITRGSERVVVRFSNEEVVSHPSPGEGHKNPSSEKIKKECA